MLVCPKCNKIFLRDFNCGKHLSRCLFTTRKEAGEARLLSGGGDPDRDAYWELKRIHKKHSKKWGSDTLKFTYKYRNAKRDLQDSIGAIDSFFKSLTNEIANFTQKNDLIQIILETDNGTLDFAVNTEYVRVRDLSNITLAEHFSRVLQSNATFRFDDNLTVTVQKIINEGR